MNLFFSRPGSPARQPAAGEPPLLKETLPDKLKFGLQKGNTYSMNLKRGWQKWLALSQIAGNFLGRILVSIFYFTLMLPFSLGVTLFGDPLQIKTRRQTHWISRETKTDSPDSIEEAKRQS